MGLQFCLRHADLSYGSTYSSIGQGCSLFLFLSMGLSACGMSPACVGDFPVICFSPMLVRFERLSFAKVPSVRVVDAPGVLGIEGVFLLYLGKFNCL